MELYYSVTSPYARKVRVVLAERQLHEAYSLKTVSPLDDAARGVLPNPLTKIPTLITDDGVALYDSAVICAYVDELGDVPSLMAPQGGDKWAMAKAHALGNGIMDAAYYLVMERRRPEAEQSPFWMQRWAQTILNGVRAIDLEAIQSEQADNPVFNYAAITHACALSYLDFRLSDIKWREVRADLADWLDVVSTRSSMAQSRPD